LGNHQFDANLSGYYSFGKKILDFLEFLEWKLEKFQKYNIFKRSEMNLDARRKLVKFFKPHNKELYKLLGVNYNWN